jgi:TRAP-type C4-dicarboxylate transport system permease small subunit
MQAILATARLWGATNAGLLWLARWLAVGCLGLMVVIILLQVFARYVLGSALPWPDEAARFFMLWMTGLMAPTALRRGGFVAIDMVLLMLPRLVASAIMLLLLCVAGLVLFVAAQLGWSEVTGFGGSFKTASLMTIFTVDFSDGIAWGWQAMPRSQMMASLLVGVWLMLTVTGELMLRQIITMLGHGDALPEIPESAAVGAE